MITKICASCDNEYETDKQHSGPHFRYCPACRPMMQKGKVYAKRRKNGPEPDSGELQDLIRNVMDMPPDMWRPLTGNWLMRGEL